MKSLCFLGLLFLSISALLYFDIISINAAEIYLKDIDVKVFYYYDNDPDPFVGYNERSKVYMEQGEVGLTRNYHNLLQELLDEHEIDYFYFLIDNDELFSSKIADYTQICLYQLDFNYEIVENDSWFSKSIKMNYRAELEVSHLREKIWIEPHQYREFEMKAELQLEGICNKSFIEYQLKRIILSKIIYMARDYLYGYHGIIPPESPI